MDELMNKGTDHVTILSITDSTKTFLPDTYQPKNIEHTYEMELKGRLSEKNYDIHMDEIRKNLDVKDQIAKWAHQLECNSKNPYKKR